MERSSLSVVIPVYNEAAHLTATMRALSAAVHGSDFAAEAVVVDDGSTDGTAEAARASADGRLTVRIVSQPNRGRFEARRAGLARARGEYVLFLDSRVRLVPGALRFVRERLQSAPVWNGHVHVDADNAWGELLLLPVVRP
jgi:glycosyltransferase involved in cell wall biosynthesis